jgi:EmrB/QacA subfamily drug resistance transporter
MFVLIPLLAAQFMVILDITVVNIALPSIQSDLGIAMADLQWLITAYTLAFGGLLLLGGRAADALGRRNVFFAGLTVFTGASLAAGFANSDEALLVARVGQGIGAAMLSPAALSLVTTHFPEGPERRRALAAWAAVAASGGAFGVLAGGLLSETLDWRAIFFINVPVGIAAGIAVARTIPRGWSARRGRLDFGGAALATGSLVALIYGLVEAPEAGWGSAQTLGLLGAAALGLAAFVAVEGRVREPLVTLAVFRNRSTVVALVLMIAGMGTVLSAFFFLTQYLQGVLGHSALRTGLEFLPGAVLLVVTAHAGGVLLSRFGARPVLVGGMTLAALGAFLLSDVSAGGGYFADVLPGLLILDAGVGFAASAIFITGMAGVRDEHAGAVSGLLTTSHELGIALILPVLSTIAVSTIGVSNLEAAAGLDPGVVTAGFADAFKVASAISLGAALIALVALPRIELAGGHGHGHAAMAH